jgi:hypothetical protein
MLRPIPKSKSVLASVAPVGQRICVYLRFLVSFVFSWPILEIEDLLLFVPAASGAARRESHAITRSHRHPCPGFP